MKIEISKEWCINMAKTEQGQNVDAGCAQMITTIIVIDDKYTIKHEAGTNLRAERHGEPWRTMDGDGLILAMAQRIESLEQEVRELKS